MAAWQKYSLIYALILVALYPVQARAESLPYDSWRIGPISAASQNGRDFCSMKKSFGDVTLILARDTADEDTIAFESKTKILRAGVQYPVSLGVDLLTREIMGMAATPQVLMVKLAKDPAFLESMAAGAVLNVSFADKKFNFGLEGTRDAIEALDECVAWRKNGGTPPSHMSFKSAPLQINREVISHVTPANRRALERLNPAQQARTELLQDEVERLRTENRTLLLEKQKSEAELIQLERSAEQTSAHEEKPSPVKKVDSFLESIDAYVAEKKADCRGEFAHQLSAVSNVGTFKVRTGEMACLGERDSGAAALLFVEEAERLKVMVHQGKPDDMLRALKKRDAALAALK